MATTPSRSLKLRLSLFLAALLLGAGASAREPSQQSSNLPDPVVDSALVKSGGQQTAVFAGGCFWGVQAVFQHVTGVVSATSGYSGGDAGSARYDTVSRGRSGHAESVRVVFDPAKITYGKLLKVFFSVAHDPTQLNRQGPDSGTQYRSAIFTSSPEQEKIARAYVAQLDAASVYPARIVTQIAPLAAFYPAEDYHQDFFARNPNQGYCMAVAAPKVAKFRKTFSSRLKKAAAE